MTVPPAALTTTQPHRTVARPVANLGNTCYVNCVLQALAHAPELCLAMDCEPHREACPIAAENSTKSRGSRSSSPEDSEPRKVGTRKSRRRSPQTLQQQQQQQQGGGGGEALDDGSDLEFCALCEVEEHLRKVHDSTKKDKPVVPSTFVHGFIQHVAPWFKLGVQEDSHEFLRLLIDAMQKSCQRARPGAAPSLQDDRDDQDSQNDDDDDDHGKPRDTEYPFSLFRGTVESTVTCEHCKASSSTLDPIEDVGLEVTLPTLSSPPPPSTDRSSSSRTNSPIPALADVQTAFQRFARAEELDAGYKCEKCGKVGRATKQSHLASIPPILTLQLKRFRYGDGRGVAPAPTGRRTGRSEVNQLLGHSNDFWTAGKSGSAKIEGHIKFDLFFDLKPYLTPKLQGQHSNMYCRLFAVIVHAGKNSHSGHYIAYVRNVSKNEWWKMDDGRVTAAPLGEVMQAEAYMLFYRVVQHPVALRLEALNKQRTTRAVAAGVMEPPVDQAVDGKKAKEKEMVSRKRPVSEDFADGFEWVRAKTNLPPSLINSVIRKAQILVSEDVQLSAEYFKVISDEAAQEDAAIGKGPSSGIGGKITKHVLEGNTIHYVGSYIQRVFRSHLAADSSSRTRYRRWS